MNTRTVRFPYRSLVVFLVAVLLAGLTLGAAPAPRLQSTQVASALAGGQLKTGGALEAARASLFQAGGRLPADSSAGFWLPAGGVSHGGIIAAVNAIAISGSDVYLGGFFTNPGNNIIKWDTNANTYVQLGGGTSTGDMDVVCAIAVSGSDMYVGGSFASVGNGMANTSYIAKWNTSTKTWSALGTGVDGTVFAIAFSGSDVYMGGYFTSAGGVAASNIAKWNSLTNTWSALGAGMTGGLDKGVYAITISGSDVYVGGEFDHAGGVAASNIAKWDSSTSTWSALGAGTTGGTTNGPVIKAIAISGSDVYVGGDFSSAGGMAASNIAKWNSSTSTWSALGTGVVGGLGTLGVHAIAISGSEVYAGGVFDHAGGVAANNVAMWDSSMSTWSALGAGTDGAYGGDVRAIVTKGGDAYIGGVFQYAGGVYAGGIARWNDGTFVSRWSALGTGVNSSVTAIAVSGSDVYVGGNFSSAGTCTSDCNYIAKWDGTTWSALGTGVNSSVAAIAVSGGDVYVGGNFSSAGTCTSGCNYIAKWDGTTWSALGTGVNNTVNAIVINGTDVYVGGRFGAAGSVANTPGIAKWNTSTNTWSALGTGISTGQYSFISAIAVSGSDVYVGGYFPQAGTCTTGCNNIARWNSSTNTWSALGTGTNSWVDAIAFNGSDVYMGGNFSSAGICTSGCNYIAKWNPSTNTWSALNIGTYSTGGPVYALAANGSDVYVGGYFPNAFSMVVANIVKLNASAGTASALESGVDNAVTALAITPSGSDVYAGGNFSKAGLVCTSAKGCTFIAKWDASGPSSNADLSNLVLSSGTLTPVFASATTAYTATVPSSVTSITLTPTAAEAHATITVSGATVASGSPSGVIALHLGENAIPIVVTAQDGTIIKTYTVTVTRGAPLSKIYLPLVVR